MKKYFDKDEHCGTELFKKATEKMENGEREWDYDKVKIEAMIHQTVRSLISNELVKITTIDATIVSYDDLAGEEGKEEPGKEKTNIRRTENTYTNTEISDDRIIEMVKDKLPKIDGDIDLVSIMVMDEIMGNNGTTYEEIAGSLKIGEKEVKNAFERIRRARNKVWAKLGDTDKEYLENLKIDYKLKDVVKKIKKSEEKERKKETE
ncbi:MAG: hypothetical protein NTY74_11810 [Ignavibacteriae bacterium]|nr:hypothetical protein [Ignavibacteriota bacterium]